MKTPNYWSNMGSILGLEEFFKTAFVYKKTEMTDCFIKVEMTFTWSQNGSLYMESKWFTWLSW